MRKHLTVAVSLLILVVACTAKVCATAPAPPAQVRAGAVSRDANATTSAPLQTVTYELAPPGLSSEPAEHILAMAGYIAEVLGAMLHVPDTGIAGPTAQATFRYDPTSLAFTVTDSPENLQAVASLLIGLDRQDLTSHSLTPSGTSVTRTLGTDSELVFHGLRVRLLRVTENDPSDPHDDTVELVIRTPTTSQDCILGLGVPQYIEQYMIQAESIEPEGLGRGLVTLTVRGPDATVPEGTVRGRIVARSSPHPIPASLAPQPTTEGVPISGARLAFGIRETTVIYSGEDGSFEVSNLGHGSMCVTATAPGYRRETLSLFPRRFPLELSLSPGRSLHGRILAGDGRPIQGATVQLYADGDWTSGMTDADGFYLIERVPGRLLNPFSWTPTTSRVAATVRHPDYAALHFYVMELDPKVMAAV